MDNASEDDGGHSGHALRGSQCMPKNAFRRGCSASSNLSLRVTIVNNMLIWAVWPVASQLILFVGLKVCRLKHCTYSARKMYRYKLQNFNAH